MKIFTPLWFFMLAPGVLAERILKSYSLNTCQEVAGFSASQFDVVFTPGNNSVSVKMVATSIINAKIVLDLHLSAYGLDFMQKTIDPCEDKKIGFCPMVPADYNIPFTLTVPKDAVAKIPGIAFTVPDLDARVRAYINRTSTHDSVACIETRFSNGKTVDLPAVKWAIAVFSCLALISSAILKTLGHHNTAAHISAKSLSLFGFLQSQAIIGSTGVTLPPIVQAWTQDLQWSMGIIRVGFLQTAFTWYQRATGGTPSTHLDSTKVLSVVLQKRDIESAESGSLEIASQGLSTLFTRADEITKPTVLFGLDRVAYRAGIESTNLFMTGIVSFLVLALVVILAVVGSKGVCEIIARRGLDKNGRLVDFRNGWASTLKGCLIRVCLVGFPPIILLCIWEYTQVDSTAEAVLAVLLLLGIIACLLYASFRVIRVARRGSSSLNQSLDYILFADNERLNQFGCLYIQFRAPVYYSMLPVLVYTFIKALFVVLAQKHGLVQAIGLILAEAAALIAASVFRPWMDKGTNSFNIAICAVNFFNAICLLMFSNPFAAPGIVIGVFGIVFFILNAAFSLVLLLLIIGYIVTSFWRKEPDARYQLMADRRTSFMKSRTSLHAPTELEELRAVARGGNAPKFP